MIASAVLFCLSLLQSQQDEVTLTAATISSSDTEFGQSYELTQFELVSPIVSLRANRAVIELANSENSVTPPVSWANELVRGIGLSNTDFSIKSVSIEGNVLFSDSRLSISADLLSFSPATGTSEFKNLSATFESNTVGPNGWPVIINAERMLESPGQIIEFFECDFSTCLEETQHYSTSFSYLRATKTDDDKMFWQPQGAWLNIFGVPVLPLPAPDFVDGDDFFGLKGINFGSSRITGNQIVPQFGGRKIFDNGDEFNWNFDLGYSDLRGAPIFSALKYVTKNHLSKVRLFYLDDQNDDFHRLTNTISRANNERYLIDFKNTWSLDPKWDLFSRFAATSDHLVMPEFFNREWITERDAETRVELVRRSNSDYFNFKVTAPTTGSGFTPLGGFNSAPGPQGQYLSYAPSISFDSYSTNENWMPRWLSTSWGAKYSRMRLHDQNLISASGANYITNPAADREIASAWGQANANFNFGGFNISPQLKLHGGSWRESLPVSVNDNQLYLESLISASTILIRNYSDGWSHKVVPSLAVRAQTELIDAGQAPIGFDGDSLLQQGRLIEFGVRQFFYAPQADSPWLDLQILQPYYLSDGALVNSSLMPFRRDQVTSGLGPSEFRMKWTPSSYGSALDGLSANFNLRYDFEFDSADEIVAHLGMRPDKNYFYGLNYLEANSTPQDFSLGSIYAGFRFSQEWAASMRKSRNFSGNAGFYSTWEVTHYAHDFSIELGYTLVEATGADGFYFSISPRFVHDKFNSLEYSLRDIR